MNPILQDFTLDLDRLKRLLALAEMITAFPSCKYEPDAVEGELLQKTVAGLHVTSKECHPDMPILNGVLLLYLAGRLENFVREIFEDLCDSITADMSEFSHLPRQMQENLVKYTADVIASPRKYGHAENGVIAFVSTLSDNLNGKPLHAVNSKCLSITLENMWPETLAEIFSRIGANKVWERLGQQASVQGFFQTDQAEKATRESRKFLTAFMELRNQIAHPSGALSWPSVEQTRKHIEFCETTARALADICAVWSTTLGTRVMPITDSSSTVATTSEEVVNE
jgi:hypothetical protein